MGMQKLKEVWYETPQRKQKLLSEVSVFLPVNSAGPLPDHLCHLYFAADFTIRNEILLSSENSLHQFFSNVDTRLSEMVSTCFNVLQNNTVKRRAYDIQNGALESGYETYEIKQYLSGLPRDTFSDVFVYYYGSDQVISAGYSTLAGEYYSTTYYALSATPPQRISNGC